MQDHPAFLLPTTSSGGSPAALGFNNLLGNLTELTESLCSHGHGLFQGKDRDHIQWLKEETQHRAQKGSKRKASVFSPHGVRTHQCLGINGC